MGAKALAVALSRPKPEPAVPTVATGPYIREASAGPALDTLRVAAPIAFKGRLVRCAGRILRLHPGKITADPRLPRPVNRRPRRMAGQAFPGYIGLGFPDPSAWLLKQAPAARKGSARTPDACAAITLQPFQPSSPRLQAARRDVSQRPDPGQTAVGSNGTQRLHE